MNSLSISAQILHASSTNKNALKALVTAEYSGVKVELVKDFVMGVSNKTPEFLKMNPIGKVCSISRKFTNHAESIIFTDFQFLFQVPVLETPDGPVFESNAIARYGTCSSFFSPF